MFQLHPGVVRFTLAIPPDRALSPSPPYHGGSFLTPAKWQNARRLSATHPRPNRRARLVPPVAASATSVQFPQQRQSVRPFQAPREELAYGSEPPSAVWYWRAARFAPATAIGPGSKFRPDRCRRLITPLASLARQPHRRARWASRPHAVSPLSFPPLESPFPDPPFQT